MRIKTHTGSITAGVHSSNHVEICVAFDGEPLYKIDPKETGILLTASECYMLAGALLAIAEQAAYPQR